MYMESRGTVLRALVLLGYNRQSMAYFRRVPVCNLNQEVCVDNGAVGNRR